MSAVSDNDATTQSQSTRVKGMFRRMTRVQNIMNITASFMRHLSLGLVLVAFSLYGMVVYVYFAYVIQFLNLSLLTAHGFSITMVGIFILINLLFNHFMAAKTSPGFVNFPQEQKMSDGDFDRAFAEERRKLIASGERFGKLCKHCRAPKPERAHHCSICRKCVLKQDHHCPWIANCVGYHNYRYFCMFLFYLWIGCIYVCILTGPALLPAYRLPYFDYNFDFKQKILFVTVLCFAAGISVTMLGGFHLYLVLTNQTTIEVHANVISKRKARRTGGYWVNPYDLGYRANIEEVFGIGRFILCCFLPFGTTPNNEGVRFRMKPRRPEELKSLLTI